VVPLKERFECIKCKNSGNSDYENVKCKGNDWDSVLNLTENAKCGIIMFKEELSKLGILTENIKSFIDFKKNL